MYIHQSPNWPHFTYNQEDTSALLSEVRFAQGKLLGRVQDWGFDPRQKASMQTIVQDVVTNSQIEGEVLPVDQVRSSVAQKLGLPDAGLVATSRDVDGVVEMMLDATQHYDQPLTNERLWAWHAALFPEGRSGLSKIIVGRYRDNSADDPMQVISGSFGRPKIHFEAPPSTRLLPEMKALLDYINVTSQREDPIIAAAKAHLWFLTLHPFDDGNGRIARAITDSMLSRADGFKQRFYSMSSAILAGRKYYYRTLESTQKGNGDITEWILWFLKTLGTALDESNTILANTFAKAKFWQRHATLPINSRQRLILNKMWDGYAGKLTSSRYAKFADCSQDTAGRDVNKLMDWGILKIGPAGGRSTEYLLVKEDTPAD
ncbi:Fic family protein [Lewinella sp. 4G2]|uniref:Fic family protein n=1 Tax=Lewinella sp. 4G2 TaxID=1803372 RepID=UPI0007B4EFA4|nr:Fic family protein [Lewinella sp. 4G2]OAV45957.1 cell filamentation protein Fic [Lewinella sp. 4G2]